MRSAVPGSPTTDWTRIVAVAVVVLALWAAEIAVVAGLRYEWDLRAFARFGRRSTAARVVAGVPLSGERGYDGQFYAALATDPLLRRDETRRALDNPRYRSGRILLPAIAWSVTGGSRDLAPVAYVLLCWIGALAGPLVAVLWSGRPGGVSPWWALALCLSPGISTSVLRAMPDGAAAALVVGGLWSWSSNRRAPAIGLLTLAMLCRETSWVFITGAALADLTRGRWRAAVMLWSLPAVPWLVWRQWLVAHAVRGRVGLGHNVAAPFEGIRSWIDGWPGLTDLLRGPETFAMVGLVVLVAATGVHLIERRTLTAAAGAIVAGVALATMLSDLVWVSLLAWARVLAVLPLLGLVVMAASGPRVRRAYGVALVAFAVSGVLLCQIEWTDATRGFARGRVIQRSVGLAGGLGSRHPDMEGERRDRVPNQGMDVAPPVPSPAFAHTHAPLVAASGSTSSAVCGMRASVRSESWFKTVSATGSATATATEPDVDADRVTPRRRCPCESSAADRP